uniref:Uncharacterized protein n=1 Tax=Avena sativa TaxID=4498 RepID=A0ACD5YNB0_AVESA
MFKKKQPPAPGLQLGDACTLEEALVDTSAYIVDEQNHTTAYSLTSDGRKVQVSFFLAQPPRVSHFCVSCTNGAPTEFSKEPKLVATEGNLALFLVKHGSYRAKHEYYVYRAPVAADGVPPMLDKVSHPEPDVFLHHVSSYYFHDDEVGFLRYRRGGSDAYKIATLRTHDLNRRESRCNLYTYDSLTRTWERKAAVLADQQYENRVLGHHCYMVINIGGDAGTMGWVDLEHGIILCDVLGGEEDTPTSRLIRYVPLPDEGPPEDENVTRGPSRRYRSVAAVHGRIEYVEVQIHVRPGRRPRRLHGTYFSAGWTVVRWSTTAAAVGSSGWQMDCKLSSSDITVPADMAALLPTLPKDIDDDVTTLERLHVGHPTISLGEDSDIVYFMAKIDELEKDAWVIAVNTKTKLLLGVTEFTPRCIYSMEFTYMPTTISKYLTPALTKVGM